jgi:hypothetical protein
VSPRLRTIAIGVAAIVATWVAVIHETTEKVRAFSDSLVYLQIAAQPFRVAHLIFPKPLFLPVVYRGLGGELGRIGDFQMVFSFVAWTVLGATWVACLRGRWPRVIAGVLVAAFVLAPFRVGFMTVALSESIDDSLLALLLAGAIALTFVRARLAVAWAMAGVAAAWILTRDTNAITALVAIAAAAFAWRLHRTLRRERWALPLVVVPALVAVVALWTTGQRPPLPTGIDEYADWPAEMMARRTYPTTSAILARLGDDDSARAFFADRGMPQTDDLATLQHSPETRLVGGEDERWCCRSTFAPARAWIGDHGGAYLAWIARHPLSRIAEYLGASRELVAPTTLTMYMPPHWKKPSGVLGLLRSVTGHWLFALVLVIAAPWALWRPRARPLALVAIACIASGVVAGFFAYYGDARELSRHMYGSGQQVLFGLVLALVGRLDAFVSER